MVRLVKGAYWDTEIKRSQVEGLKDFPVFTRRSATDISYIYCAKKLLSRDDRIYPQFATHNAHSVCAIQELAKDGASFEFQRLHGMGEVLHRLVKEKNNTRCRIYASVGTHRDLLAYLVRRLLENGANSSFVNQLVDETVPAEIVANDPFEVFEGLTDNSTNLITKPGELFYPSKVNSMGWDLSNVDEVESIWRARLHFEKIRWQAAPVLAVQHEGEPVLMEANPANYGDKV